MRCFFEFKAFFAGLFDSSPTKNEEIGKNSRFEGYVFLFGAAKAQLLFIFASVTKDNTAVGSTTSKVTSTTNRILSVDVYSFDLPIFFITEMPIGNEMKKARRSLTACAS